MAARARSAVPLRIAGAQGGPRGLTELQREMVACRACPRLVAWRELCGQEKVKRFRDWSYWSRPIPGFGDPAAQLVLMGLAPAAHGGNRTGRMFTGDRSGDFLFAALHRAGFANQPASVHRQDGLRLRDAFIVAPCRCAPPANVPRPDELRRLPRCRVVLALGAVGWDATLQHFSRRGIPVPRPRPRFAHGAVVRLAGTPALLGSYHVSQQNTNTGKLTPGMMDAVLSRARELLES